jgi:hypothetical protein
LPQLVRAAVLAVTIPVAAAAILVTVVFAIAVLSIAIIWILRLRGRAQGDPYSKQQRKHQDGAPDSAL